MKRFTLVLLLAAVALSAASAADVTGKWSGTWENGPDGGPGPHYMVLKQDGSTVTGTAGPSADQQAKISNGSITGDTLLFDVRLGAVAVLKFEFKIDGDTAKGGAKLEMNGKVQDLKLSAKRVP